LVLYCLGFGILVVVFLFITLIDSGVPPSHPQAWAVWAMDWAVLPQSLALAVPPGG
jgi:hypothetical protein